MMAILEGIKISSSFLHNYNETTIGVKISFPPDYENPEAIRLLAKHLEDEIKWFFTVGDKS